MDKKYQYLCGKYDNTTPLIHDKMMTSKELIELDKRNWTSGMEQYKKYNQTKKAKVVPVITGGGSKQKRRTQRKRRKH